MADLPRELTIPKGNAATIDWLLRDLRNEIVVWVGAGLSKPLGYPTWAEFLTQQAEEAGVEADVGDLLGRGEYEEAARLLLETRGHRAFNDAIDIVFNELRITGGRIEGAIAHVPQLTNRLIVTTNFDRVLERVCIEQLGVALKPVMGSDEQQATAAVQTGRRAILKLHGDIEEHSHRVLTNEDYERAYGPTDVATGMPGQLVRLLDLVFTKRVLFLGASLQLDRTVRALRHAVEHNKDLQHYAVVERPTDTRNRRARAKDLSDLGISPIWYPEGKHDLVERLLAYLVASREETKAPSGAAVGLPALVQDGEEWLHVAYTADAPREIIEARLAALDGSLHRDDDPRDWPKQLNLETQVVPPTLWGQLTEQIDRKREDQRNELDEITDHLATVKGRRPAWGTLWDEYSKLNSESRRLFRDFLELLGGLAVRGKLGDERLLRVADELIKECAELDMWGRDSSVAIPAIKEALARTPTGIVRLRFPEWTIWNLALIAHEYGHVVMEGMLDAVLHEATELRAGGLPGTNENAKPDERRARRQLQVLVADVFAAYVLGPAYGCAAIVLKLDPSAEADWDSPADAERAHVILAILKKLEGFERSPSYREVIGFLEDRWKQLVRRVEPAAALKRPQIRRLDKFVDALYDAFEALKRESKLLRTSAAYPYHFCSSSSWDPADGGWLVAESWARGWLAVLDNPDATAFEIPSKSRVRDVLNAAWICRVARPRPEEIARIVELAEEACLRLVPEREGEPPATATPSQSSAITIPARR
jgi:hypothetical protein